jgi:hypothetical protein
MLASVTAWPTPREMHLSYRLRMDSNLAFTIVLVVGFGILFQRLSALSARVDRVSRLEGKLDALLRHAGVDYDPLAEVAPEVRDALERGEYVAAIKKLREATGMGLKEAKEQIDELRLRREGHA